MLENCTCYNTPPFSLSGNIYRGKVSSIYDGDTMTCIIEMFTDRFYQMKCRLQGIDTPEMIGSDHVQAVIARNRVIQLIANMDAGNMSRNMIKEFFNTHNFYVVLKCGNFDKYGRLLAEVYTEDNYKNEGESINQILLNENLAIAYYD